MGHLLLDICLTDIPAERIKTARNNKKYLKVEVGELRERDEHDNDHFVRVYVPKAEREEGVRATYIGRGKSIGENSRAENSPSKPRGKDGLPF